MSTRLQVMLFASGECPRFYPTEAIQMILEYMIITTVLTEYLQNLQI
jgi:hypothetical protein